MSAAPGALLLHADGVERLTAAGLAAFGWEALRERAGDRGLVDRLRIVGEHDPGLQAALPALLAGDADARRLAARYLRTAYLIGCCSGPELRRLMRDLRALLAALTDRARRDPLLRLLALVATVVTALTRSPRPAPLAHSPPAPLLQLDRLASAQVLGLSPPAGAPEGCQWAARDRAAWEGRRAAPA